MRDFVLVDVGVNRFFGEGNNIGVDFAHGDYIVFLNNDAFVQPGWIEALCSTMRNDPLVAAVGPMFLYPDGRVQEVGGVIVPTGDAVQIGKGAVWVPITTTRRAWSTTALRLASCCGGSTSSRLVGSDSNGNRRTTRTPTSA